jgi:hypothetical protein
MTQPDDLGEARIVSVDWASVRRVNPMIVSKSSQHDEARSRMCASRTTKSTVSLRFRVIVAITRTPRAEPRATVIRRSRHVTITKGVITKSAERC